LCIELNLEPAVLVVRRILLLILWHCGLLAGNRLSADVVTLKDDRQISGSVESGNTQELHIKVGDQSQTIDIHEVQAIQLGVSLPPPATATPFKTRYLRQPPTFLSQFHYLNKNKLKAGWMIQR
jgi:hypothetical protein